MKAIISKKTRRQVILFSETQTFHLSSTWRWNEDRFPPQLCTNTHIYSFYKFIHALMGKWFDCDWKFRSDRNEWQLSGINRQQFMQLAWWFSKKRNSVAADKNQKMRNRSITIIIIIIIIKMPLFSIDFLCKWNFVCVVIDIGDIGVAFNALSLICEMPHRLADLAGHQIFNFFLLLLLFPRTKLLR